MLTPKFLQRITEATEKKTGEVNEYLTQRIVDRILHVYEKTGEVNVNSAALFDALKQQESGKLFDEVVEEIARRMPEIQEEVRQAFYDSAGKISKDMYDFTQRVIEIEHEAGELLDIDLPDITDWEQVGIPKTAKDLHLTPKEIRMLEAAYKRTNGEIYNITQSTALATERTFVDACDNAWWKVMHGVSPDVAIMEAIEEAAAKGITTVHYANREEKIEVAIARAVKTGVNQANGDITLTRCAEMGVGYVLVNEHIGARVTKAEDYTNHAHWQGKVYKLDWGNAKLAKYEPAQEEIKENKKSFGFLEKIKQFLSRKPTRQYEDFITVCGYGKMLGICGINCRHSFNPFYPDININTNKGFDKQENEERYRNEQKQRTMERTIRELKRREAALKHAENQTDNEEITKRRIELQERIKEKREEYIEFCKDKKLTRESYRLQIAKKYGVSNGDDGIIDKKVAVAGIADKFDRKTKLYTKDEDLKAVNPNFSTGEEKWTKNCQRCVPTYEMRRRGFDVIALPLEGDIEKDSIALDCFNVWENAIPMKFTNKEQLDKIVDKMNIGARVQISVNWENGEGHTFVAERTSEGVCYMDPQSGVFNYLVWSSQMIGNGKYCRIDNLQPKDVIFDCCTVRR